MSITTLEYTGTAPGADTNVYPLFNTVTAGCPGNWAPMAGMHVYRYDIQNSASGTVRLSKSSNRGVSWTVVQETAVAALVVGTPNADELSIESFVDFKVDWVNGGSAQSTWVVDQNVSSFP